MLNTKSQPDKYVRISFDMILRNEFKYNWISCLCRLCPLVSEWYFARRWLRNNGQFQRLTIELQIGLKNYDPQKLKQFKGSVKLPPHSSP